MVGQSCGLTCEELIAQLADYTVLHEPFRDDQIDGLALSESTPEDFDGYPIKGMKKKAFLRVVERWKTDGVAI